MAQNIYPMQEEAEIVQTKSRLQALLYFSNVAFYGGVTTKFTYNVKIPDSKNNNDSLTKNWIKKL